MGNANIDESLKKEILKLLNNKDFRIKYQTLKGFIDNACSKELELVKNNAETETKKQVAAATTALKNQYENDIKLLHSENKAVAAENASKNKFLDSQVTTLQEQVNTLYGQLNSERNAGIERAKASSIGNLNVGVATGASVFEKPNPNKLELDVGVGSGSEVGNFVVLLTSFTGCGFAGSSVGLSLTINKSIKPIISIFSYLFIKDKKLK